MGEFLDVGEKHPQSVNRLLCIAQCCTEPSNHSRRKLPHSKGGGPLSLESSPQEWDAKSTQKKTENDLERMTVTTTFTSRLDDVP